MKEALLFFVQIFFDLLNWVVFLYIMASWFTGPGNKFYDVLGDLSRPILNLAKQITPKAGMLDLSPLVALLGLEVVKNILIQLIRLI